MRNGDDCIGSTMNCRDGRIFQHYADGRTVEVTHRTVPSFQEQLGTDSMSKLAAAINRLCDVLEPKE